MASFGLLGITISEEYGGSGADFVTAAIATEEIARADISMATAVYYLVEAGWGFLMDRYGSKKAKEDILSDVTKGKTFLGIASTEAAGGFRCSRYIYYDDKRGRKVGGKWLKDLYKRCQRGY